MSTPLLEIVCVVPGLWLWALLLWFLPSPGPRVELVDRDEEEVS